MIVINQQTGKQIRKLPPKLEAAKRLLEALFDPILQSLKGYDIPEGNETKVIDYALGKLRSNPYQKPEKVVRKTVEYFKLKVRKNEGS